MDRKRRRPQAGSQGGSSLSELVDRSRWDRQGARRRTQGGTASSPQSLSTSVRREVSVPGV